MLLKSVLLAYSQGIASSRAIERACRVNVLFIALTSDAKPHFTTIADFVSRLRPDLAIDVHGALPSVPHDLDHDEGLRPRAGEGRQHFRLTKPR